MTKGVITGTSQGLGRELVTQLAPNMDELVEINRRKTGAQKEIICDLSSKSAVDQAAKELVAAFTGQDPILFILNAGDYGEDETVSDATPDEVGRIIYANVFGQLTLVESLIKAGHKVNVVAISSGMASISDPREPYHYIYSASKAALNLCVRLMQKQYRKDYFEYLLINPGWMQTRMGGAGATIDPADTARFIVEALDDDTKWNDPTGMINAEDGTVYPW